MLLPPASQVHAIVVGIERYVPLGENFKAPGAVAGALAFARWLVHQRGVAPAAVDLWLAPLDGSDPAAHAQAAGLAGTRVRTFSWAAFFEAMAQPSGPALDGSFLLVYVCSHGVVSGTGAQQYLVLPEATEQQFLCLDTANWRLHFSSAGWERFGHQLWVIDACRNQWGDAMQPLPASWHLGALQAVRQCVLFSCASGESASIDAKLGPRFTRELLGPLAAAAAGEWPDFEQALRDTAALLRADPTLAQSPTIIGQGWHGLPLVGDGLVGRRLADALADLPWPYERLKPYVARAIPPAALRSAPSDLPTALELLHDLRPVDGVPPLLDFAERVARASALKSLRDWVDAQTSEQQKAQLENRLADDGCHARLLLWYRDDMAPACIEGELQVIDVGGGVQPWQRVPAKVVTSDAVAATLGQWLQAVYEHVGERKLELEVEIYLPRKLLTSAAYDTATLPMAGGEELRLGEDHPALLRCTDRYKGPVKFKRLQSQAPRILARIGSAGGEPLRWAKAGEAAQALKSAFVADTPAAPAWLGFDPAECGGDGPLDTALTEGLPAVLWLRAPVAAGGRAQLETSLRGLLSVALAGLPARLTGWRSEQIDAASRTVALLIDDPDRRPALLNAWTQPGG